MPKYRVVHNNHYSFQQAVNHCTLEARLQPVDNKQQSVEFSQFVLQPLAKSQHSAKDEFGNQVNYFEITRGLQSFSLSAIHTVLTRPLVDIDLATSTPWEQVADMADIDIGLTALYLNGAKSSPYVAFNEVITAYAKHSFSPGMPLLQAALDLMQRVHADFEYDQYATQVDTTATDAFDLKRGVCQDFTHLAIACLRSLGLPVRYVSGYVDTKTASGQPRRYAGDVSHAWYSVYDPDHGWVDFDPTNNIMPGETYITVAYGRDYHDISPLKGLVDSQGHNQLKVNVDMSVLN